MTREQMEGIAALKELDNLRRKIDPRLKPPYNPLWFWEC